MKIGIIGGAGTLGSNIAFYAALKNLAEEIVLVDVKENVVKAIAMDMGQAISEINNTKVLSGLWDGLKGCGIVVNTASMPERSVKSRLEYLENNLEIIKNVAEQIKKYCPEAIIINATNPIDIFNFILHKLTGMPAKQFVGFSGNDTLRLKWAVAKVKGVNTYDVEALVIGEHGDAQVPLFSKIKEKGADISLTPDEKSQTDDMIKNWFLSYQALDSGRTTGFTSAIGVGRLIEAIVKNTGEILPGSAILSGQYGLYDVSIGMPITLGPGGIEKIHELQLTEDEINGLRAAVKKNRDILRGLNP